MSLQSSLLAERKLVVVTGKGGTGKTTIASALALAASESGMRVLLAELGRESRCPLLLGIDANPSAAQIREFRPNLFTLRIDPFEALDEYLRLQGGAGALIARGLRGRGLHDLLVGTPGWRELITLGKLWYMAQGVRDDGSPNYDLIIVDAPATGHGLTLLDVPRVVHSAVRTGPLARNAARVAAMLRDPVDTLLLPICLPETLPVRETIELVGRMRDEVGVHVDRVVVNAMAAPSAVEAWPDLPERLQQSEVAVTIGEGFRVLPPPSVMARCAGWALDRAAAHREALRPLGEDLDCAQVHLPDWPGGTLPDGSPDLERLRSLGLRLLEPLPPDQMAREERTS